MKNLEELQKELEVAKANGAATNKIKNEIRKVLETLVYENDIDETIINDIVEETITSDEEPLQSELDAGED